MANSKNDRAAEFTEALMELHRLNPAAVVRFAHEMRASAIVEKLAAHPVQLENWLLDGEDRVEQIKSKRRKASKRRAS